jgi:hypothetical protein
MRSKAQIPHTSYAIIMEKTQKYGKHMKGWSYE